MKRSIRELRVAFERAERRRVALLKLLHEAKSWIEYDTKLDARIDREIEKNWAYDPFDPPRPIGYPVDTP